MVQRAGYLETRDRREVSHTLKISKRYEQNESRQTNFRKPSVCPQFPKLGDRWDGLPPLVLMKRHFCVHGVQVDLPSLPVVVHHRCQNLLEYPKYPQVGIGDEQESADWLGGFTIIQLEVVEFCSE